MISVSKKVGIALLLLSLAAPAYAQVCKEPGAGDSGKANMTCDMSYRDQLVVCDTANTTDIVGTRPACPKKPMPMINTPNQSYIQDYTPYLWNYPRDATDPSRPYAGAYALGTPGDTSRTFQIFGNTAPGTKRLASCTAQIHVPSNPTTNSEWAKLTRLQLDNCTNQYILNAAIYPVQKDSSKLLSMDDPTHPSKTLNIGGECQPLQTFDESENEYNANDYLKAAWQKLLQDPGYRYSTPSALKCVPCIGGLLEACDHEPHLPCQAPLKQGLSIDNPLPPPSPFPEVRLSSISAIKYENINDPSHPFSPRWDFLLDDRDYSNLDYAQLLALSPTAAAIKLALGTYMSKVDNSVFCAGVRSADADSDAKKKADDEVPVDVLSFRRSEFEDALGQRTAYNSACYMEPTTWPLRYETSTPLIWPMYFLFAIGSWCYQIDGPYMASYVQIGFYVHNNSCWQCYNLNGKVDDTGDYNNSTNKHPPCTTQYLGHDLDMNNSDTPIPGGLNFFTPDAKCGTKMSKICEDLRRPYTNLNVLKMRYHRTDDPDDKDLNNNVLKNGTGEGMTFKEYFGNHMPYPRIWDMGGKSLQLSAGDDIKLQQPLDTTGQYTAIVGIGREAASKTASDAAGTDSDGKSALDKHKDERCLTGGWGTIFPVVTFGGVSLTVPDPLTSWTEMKLYESRTLRNVGMSCLGRYEKIFKPGDAENMMLLRTGGMWQQLIVTKCDKDTNGLTKNCTSMSYSDCLADPNCLKADASGSSAIYIKNINTQSIPQPWRGYLSVASSADAANQFPLWPGDGTPSIAATGGLNNATQGDIILLPNGPNPSAGKGLAKLAFVIETRLPSNTDCATKKDCYVRVLEPDDGKWPDSCGTTDTWGEMKTRYYYPPGMLPYNAQQEYSHISSIGDCIETKISHCEMNAWSSLQVYHIRDDKRSGCQHKDKAVNCEKDE